MSSRSSLNHVFRSVWNQALGAMVAVAEIDTSSGRSGARRIKSAASALPPPSPSLASPSALTLAIALAWSAVPVQSYANPTGGVAVVGQASMANNGNKLLVTTQNGAGTNYSAINWQSFSIPVGSSTYFAQPTASSTSINRVVTNTPTQIFGTLSSNGNLVLVNQAGIAVGTGAVVDTNGFTASSLAMSDADAMAGRLRFGDGSISTAAVSVDGSILARNGDVVLLGSGVNTGVNALVQAPNGSTVLAAGQQVEITGRGLEGIRMQVQAPADTAVNLGTLKGDAVAMFAGTLRHSGAIQATTATLEGGRVVLKASGDAYVEGAGSITATGVTGGSVDVLGQRVAVLDNASIDVSGQTGGGSIRVGGDYHGKNASVPNAAVTYVGSGTQLLANAGDSGEGGKIVVWADDTTRYFGTISANGGAQSGSGGFVEVSGKNFLSFNGLVSTAAQKGNKGTLLLDPTNIFIATDQPTATALGMVGTDNSVDLAGPILFSTLGSPTDSLLTTGILNAALVSNNVTVDTAGYGSGVGNIVVGSNVTKSAGTATTLTLQANHNIVLNAGVSIGSTSTASPLGVTLDSTGGLTLDTGSSIVSKGGNITIRNNGTGALAVSGSVNAGTGDVLIGQTGGDSTSIITVGSGTTVAGNRVQLYTSGISAGITSSGTLSGGSSGVDLTAPGAISVGTVSSTGNVALTASYSGYGGDITQTGAISASGNLNLTLLASYSATLDNASNSVSGLTLSNAGTQQVTYWNNGALSLGTITTGASGGSVTLKTQGGALTQSAAMNLGTSGSLTVDAGAGNITLTNAGNVISSLTFTGGAVQLVDTKPVNIQGSASSLTLSTNAYGGYVNQNSALTISGNTSITASQGDISLYSTGNSFGGTVSLNTSAGYADLTAGSALNLAASNVSGTLYLNAGTNTITQTGALTIGGTTTLNDSYGTGYGAITLMNASNSFGGDVSAYGSAISIKGSGALSVGTVQSSSGSIVLQSTGSLTLNNTVTGNGGDVSLVAATSFNDNGYGVSVTGGRWLVYSANPANNSTTLVPSFQQYGSSYPASLPSGESGNGFIYSTVGQTISVALLGPVSKTYDGTTSAPLTTSNYSASLGPTDFLWAGYGSPVFVSAGTGTYSSPNVGTGINVSSVGGTAKATFASGTVYGYQLSSATGIGIGTINSAIVSLSLSGSRAYDGTTAVASSLYSLPTGVSLSGTGTSANKNVGTWGVTGFGLTGASASNYTLGSVSVTISPLALTLAGTKIYDGSTAVLAGLYSLPTGVLLSGTGASTSKNVGTWSVSGFSLSGADAANYTLGAVNVSITPLAISGITGIVAGPAREYDGTTKAVIDTSGAKLTGAISTDNLFLDLSKVVANFKDPNWGTKKPIDITGLALGGADIGNYTFDAALASASIVGDIKQRAASTWKGGASGDWSVATNWDALPVGDNVLSVNLGGANVSFNGTATKLNSLSGSALTMAGGSLTVGAGLSLAQFTQSGGSLDVASLTATSGFNQTGGTLTAGGAVSGTQTTGNLNVSGINAGSVTLTAVAGAITQSGPIVTQSLTTASATGTNLTGSGNKISAFAATNSGSGNIALTNTGVLDISGMNNANGNITVDNIGGVTTRTIVGNGNVSFTANSPLTIGDGGITATGNVALTATNLTSSGNLTINGDVVSTGGSIALAAASDFVQNSTVNAAGGVTATAGGTMTFGPSAKTVGSPLSYSDAKGALPAPGQTPVGSAPIDFVSTFMSKFEDALIAQNSATGDPTDPTKKKEADGVVVEGQSCTR